MAFDSSKYKLKYYAERTASRTGTQVRIEILEKTDTDISPMEMDALVSASLEIQGAQDKIDTPIVKTSVTITMVDAPDKSSGTVKCGDWSEFYTPDSTLYLVIIKTRENGSWATRWSGYITPDSWEERLEYRGTVSITARDNIGHLQDFQFDAEGDSEGLISIRDLVTACADKVDLPMELLLEDSGEDIAVLEDKSGNPLFDMLVNVSLFSGKSWYEALEEVLDSLGMYLRYVDNNRIMVGVLRNMPLLGNGSYDAVPQLECVFTDGSLTIDPAYKSIRETIEYEIGTDESTDVTSGLTYSETPGTYTFKPEDSADAQTAPAYSLENSSDSGWSSDMPAFLDASKYEIDDSVADVAGIDISTCAILAANADPDLSVIQKFSFGKVDSPFVRIEIGFARSALYLEGSTLKSSAALSVESIKVGARYTTPDGTVYTFEGSSWVTQDMHVRHELSLSGSSNKAQFDISKGTEGPLELQMPAGGELVLYIYSVKFSNEDNTVGPLRTGRYGCITSMSVELATDTIATLPATTVTTVNNESYNVEEEHESTICAANAHVRWFSPSTYPSVLYVRAGGTTSMANYSFRWANGEGDLPLPVVLHMEKLCYHITAFEILEGDVYLKRNGLFAYPSVNSKYTYKGNTYLLMSGSIDLLQGVLTGVALRQYLVYDDVWSDNLPDYDISGGGSSSGGSSSGSGSSGSGSGTSGLGAIKSQLDAHVSNALVHVTTAERELWNLVASLFGVDENGDVKVLGGRGLWSDSFLSSKGCDPEAGGGSGAGIDVDSLWLILGSGTNEQINASHIPSLSISKITGLQGELDSKLEGITKQMVESVLTGTITSHNHNGQYAPLSDGLIPSQYLPSFVDDVVEYSSKSAFPASGESGKIYVATDTNLTYRWSGTTYVEISPSLALGHTSSTAYPGDEGLANTQAIATLQGYFTDGAAKKVANALTINHDGGSASASAKTYNGSAAVTVNIPTTLPASDVYDWAKQPEKPSYNFSEIGNKPNTLEGYGITDGVNEVTANNNLSGSISGHSLTIGIKSGYALPSSTQIALWDKICALFGVDSDGNVYVTNNKGFYSNSFISAKGSDPEAGGGSSSGSINEDDLWKILATAGTEKIDASHIPSLSALSGQLTNAQLAYDSIAVAGVAVALGGAVTTEQIADALTDAGYKLTDTIYTLPKATVSVLGGIKAAAVRTSAITTTQGGTTSDRYYGIELDSNGKAFVNVPWVNTTYTLSSFGITATAAELNKLGGLATSATELGYVHGVTSNIQTQLDARMKVGTAGSDTAYLKKITLNGSAYNFLGTTSTALPAFYAPTYAGASGQVLKSNGSGSPSWVNANALSVLRADKLNSKAFTLSTDINWDYVFWAGPTTGCDISSMNMAALLQVGTYYSRAFQMWNCRIQNALSWRKANADGSAWDEERKILDSANYSDYTVTKTGSGASGTWPISITGNADTASKLGMSTIGGTAQGIYLNGGTATALSATVGSAVQPVYMKNGVITAGTYAFGNASGNAAMNNGTLNVNLNADKLDGHHATYFRMDNLTDWDGTYEGIALRFTSSGITGDTPYSLIGGNQATVIQVTPGSTSQYGAQLAIGFSYNRLAWRKRKTNEDGTYGWDSWQLVSAGSLVYTRTLWGQPFNGTANVSGNMTGVGSITMSGFLTAQGLATLNGGVKTSTITLVNGSNTATLSLDADGNIHATAGIWSDSFLSSKGYDPDAGSSGSGGINEDDLWDILSTAGTDKIDASHIPALSSLSGQLTNAQLVYNNIAVAGVTVALGGAVTTKQIADALAAAGYKLTDTTYGLATATAPGLLRQLNNSSTQYLRGDGTWATPPNTTYGVASPTSNGLMSAADKAKLDGIAAEANNYTLPLATSSVRGGVKIGFTTNAASRNYAVQLSNEQMFVNVPWVNTTYTLSSFGITATAAELNKLDGLSTTATELGYVHGATSNIQTQLNARMKIGTAGSDTAFLKTITLNGSAYNFLGTTSTALPAFYAPSSPGASGQVLKSNGSGSPSWMSQSDIDAGSLLTAALTSGSLNAIRTAGQLYYAGGSNSVTDKPSGVDAFGMMSLRTASGWYGQLMMSSNTATGLYWRTGNPYASDSWRKILDSKNYTDYTVSKTGGGASGTWPISISGTAATAAKVANALTIVHDGGNASAENKTYNGSAAVTINIPTALPASDVSAWAKAASKPTYTWDEIKNKPSTFTPSSHTHTKSQITDFPTSWEWSAIAGKPSTLAGYGISDGVNSVTANGNLSGSISGHKLTVGVKSGYAIPTNTQISLWNKICALFDIDSDGNVYVTNDKGFYSNSFLSAKGSDPDAGSSGGTEYGPATDDEYGLVKTGHQAIAPLGKTEADLAIGLDTEGRMYGTLSAATIGMILTTAGYKLTDTVYTLPKATVSALGGIKAAAVRSSAITTTQGGTTSGRYYGVELDSNGKAFVNVPWTSGGESDTPAAGIVLTCSTAAATGAKTVTCAGFTLVSGIVIRVCFTSGNSISAPTLNVNGTGAKAIRIYQGTTLTTPFANWQAYTTLDLRYNGTYWIIMGNPVVYSLKASSASGSVTYYRTARIFADSYKEYAFVTSTGYNGSATFTMPYAFTSTNSMGVVATLVGTTSTAAVVTAKSTSSVSVDFAYNTNSTAKKGTVMCFGY